MFNPMIQQQVLFPASAATFTIQGTLSFFLESDSPAAKQQTEKQDNDQG